jgi:hypothetical protein
MDKPAKWQSTPKRVVFVPRRMTTMMIERADDGAA